MVNRLVFNKMWAIGIKLIMVFSLFNIMLAWTKEQSLIAQTGYTQWKALIYIFGMLPSRWDKMYPLVAFLAVSWIFYIMEKNKESRTLTVLGMRPLRMIWISALFGLSWYGVFFINADIASLLENKVKHLKTEWLTSGKVLGKDNQYWLVEATDEGNDFIQFMSGQDGHLKNFKRYRYSGHDLYEIQHAEDVVKQNEDQWLLKDVTHIYYDQEIRIDHQDQMIWSTEIDVSVLLLVKTKPSLLSLRKLYYIMNNAMNGMPVGQFSEEFWSRIETPVFGPIVIWLVAILSLVWVRRMITILYFIMILFVGIIVNSLLVMGQQNAFNAGLHWPESIVLTSLVAMFFIASIQWVLIRWYRL